MRSGACILVAFTGLACGSSHQGSSSVAGSSQGAASSTGGSPGTSSAGTSGTTGGSGASGSSTGGTTTGGTTGRPLVDGGYVFCTLPSAADAGPNDDGGVASWLCQPGTYFCDQSGNLGNCFQCRGDGDCNDQSLATYDPRRPRCDLDSGVAGYQGFCQECLGDNDCTGSQVGPHCDLDAGTVVPRIDLLGFETCGQAPKAGLGDCRAAAYFVDGGCIGSFTCATDKDCAGLITRSQLEVPFCVDGSCTSCDGGVCPRATCYTDDFCAYDFGSDAGVLCNPAFYECGCTGNDQCGGFYPICLGLDAGSLSAGGQPVGLCGCDRDAQCPAGLHCLGKDTTALGTCGVSCADPRLPGCLTFEGDQAPYCDPTELLCEGCGSDAQCKPKGGVQLTGPYCRLDGACGCQTPADCPNGEVCSPPFILSSDQGHIGLCEPPPSRCTPGSCNGALCDADGGCEVGVQCGNDYDCVVDRSADNFLVCEVDAGLCQRCLVNDDCVKGGFAAQGESYCDPRSFYCSEQCAADQDCAGNSMGSSCLTNIYTQTFCGCGTDQECVGNPSGPHCDTNSSDALYGSCVCFAPSECAAGEACQLFGGTSARCGSFCQSDAACPTGFSCDLQDICRPRCDPGHSCAAPDLVCDQSNVVGGNGEPDAGGTGPIWCYQCLSATDCPAGQGCGLYAHSCGACSQRPDCRLGEACVDGSCHASCDAGACPQGEICDSAGLAGYGVDVCLQCIGPEDCPVGQGCDSTTHLCGSCRGPNASGGPFDCAADAICSNYWSLYSPGVCLQSCDERACPAGQTCELFPSITPDHKYCFGCLRDSDCADVGPTAWCDVSVGLTFSCQQ